MTKEEINEIRDEMDADMCDWGFPQGEIESLLIHWGNKYTIIRKGINVEKFDAEDFLQTKDIFNHPIISDRNDKNGKN